MIRHPLLYGILSLFLIAVAHGAKIGDINAPVPSGIPADKGLPADKPKPVDVKATRWALMDDATGEVVKDNIQWPRRDGGAYAVPGYTWLQRIDDPAPIKDARLFETTEQKQIDARGAKLTVTRTATLRPMADIEAAVDAAITQHSLICAGNSDIYSACAVAGGIAYQLADGGSPATDGQVRRAQQCVAWLRECVGPNEANGGRLLQELRDAAKAGGGKDTPAPDLDAGWTDTPAAVR